MKILVTGYAFVRKNYLDVFKYYHGNEGIYFLLPKTWKIKSGKVVYRPPVEENIFTTGTYFHHSQYPLLGGLLKGWMPWLPFFLIRQREKKFDILFSATEPSLLTALYQSIWAKIFGTTDGLLAREAAGVAARGLDINGLRYGVNIKLNMFL